jgi:von Willebrand factor type D domain
MKIKGGPNCVKGMDAWSYTCQKSSGNDCTERGFLGTSTEINNIAVGYEECQIVPVGATVEFLLKDDDLFCEAGSFSIGGRWAFCKPSDSETCTGGPENIGKECIWRIPTPEGCATTGGGGGDPHFRTYDGTTYSYHGECDLIMTRSPTFDNGMGLDVHTRTTMVGKSWSLISNAAIRIGIDTFEITNQDISYINGVEQIEYPFILAGKYPVTKEIEMLGTTTTNEWNEDFEMATNQLEPRIHYTIDLSSRSDTVPQTDSSKNQIKINIFRNMISVRVDAYMSDAEGMLGVHDTKGLVGRDHHTVYEDVNDMGAAWQVRDTDVSLFVTRGSVIYPNECKVPTKAAVSETHRQLRSYEDTKKMEDAKSACANVSSDMYSFCIEDVLRADDINMVHGFVF